MERNSYLTIKEFSHLTGIKRENLRYYNSIGLLEPIFRGENGYRYYSRSQLTTAYLIVSLRELGVSIDDIKKYINIRNPEEMFSLFKIQKDNIIEEINKLQSILDIIKLYIESVEEALSYDNTIRIVNKKKEPIFSGPIVNSNYFEDDAYLEIYNLAIEKGINTGYPLGAITYIDKSCKDFSLNVSKYYFKTEKYSNDYKPEGKYVILYGRCSYGESKALYEKLFNFIKENNLIPIGNIYEEYLINEISTLKEEDYCIKLEIKILDKN